MTGIHYICWRAAHDARGCACSSGGDECCCVFVPGIRDAGLCDNCGSSRVVVSDRDGRPDPPGEPPEPVDRALERPAPNQPGGTGARCEDDGDLRQR